MRNIGIISALSLLMACGGTREVQTLMVHEFFYDQTVGGTEEAGTNETYYFGSVIELQKLDSLQVGSDVLKLTSNGSQYYWATTALMNRSEVPQGNFRKAILYGTVSGKVAQVVLDSIPLREQIMMPSARPQGP